MTTQRTKEGVQLQKYQIAIKGRALYHAWEGMKGEYTMMDLSRVFDIPIATLFRWIKNETINRKKST